MNDRTEIIERLRGRRIIASISGGKDSAALSLFLKEMEIEHDRVFMDTGWEHDLTYDYLRGDLTRVIGPIVEIQSAQGGLEDIIRKRGMFPSRVRRFCTQEAKVFPMRDFIEKLQDDDDEFYSWADEVEHLRPKPPHAFSHPSWFQARTGGTGLTWPIDKVVEWSKTSRGGTQYDMFAADPADAGCMRWGLCDTNGEKDP